MEDKCKELEAKFKNASSIFQKHWQELKNRKGVLSVRVGTKFVNGVDTGEPAIIVYVVKKLARAGKQSIPKDIEGISTDVVELSTKDYTLGETSLSKMTPVEQMFRASGVKRNVKC